MADGITSAEIETIDKAKSIHFPELKLSWFDSTSRSILATMQFL